MTVYAGNPTIPSEAQWVFMDLRIHSISQVTQNKHSIDYIKQQNIMRKRLSWWEPHNVHIVGPGCMCWSKIKRRI